MADGQEKLEDAQSPVEENAADGATDAGDGPSQAAGEGNGTESQESYDVNQEEASELEATRRELEQTQQSLRRLHADFANYRKRMQSEKAQAETRAIGRFAREILPVLDNLERALASLENLQGGDPSSWREGIALVVRQFRDILASQGIVPIEAVGKPFDPRLHEAMAQVETEEVPENHVVEEFQRGYLYGEQTLRPSLVSVATPPRQTEQQENSQHQEGAASGTQADVVAGEGESVNG